ncbi:stage III sporulation protein AG [Fictibacillus solisalsi]|uniref:Stage III sporulation protein AG n=1 Tax=Fictibacillus solisalsi TaxID=459525 RepID=A0A1G9W7T0_9BACL|nr:stage III sporulation protein AG [Fictibacillus solisalsi]SDM80582.1 stage III sporulation protein AG [Fictibacillus solisalsi]
MEKRGSSKGWLQKLMDVLPGVKSNKGPSPYIWILLLLGFAIMIASKLFTPSSGDQANLPAMSVTKPDESKTVFKSSGTSSAKKFRDYEDTYATQLKDILEQISGVQKVRVMVTLDTTEIKEIQKNERRQNQTTKETDKNGGERTINDYKTDEEVVTIKSGDEEKPIVITTEKPKVRGVIVAAEGAENLRVKEMIIDAVTKVFDIGSDKVSVIPKKFEGE